MRKALFLSMWVLLIFSISFSTSFAEGNTKTESGGVSGSVVMNNWGSSEADFLKIIRKKSSTEFNNKKKLFHWWLLERIVFPKIGLPTTPVLGYQEYQQEYLPPSFSVKRIGNNDFLTFYKNRLMAYYTELDANAYQDYVEKLKSKYGTGSTQNASVYANGMDYAKKQSEYRLTITNWNQNDTQIFLVKSYTKWGIYDSTSVNLLYLNSPMLNEVVNEVAINVKAEGDKANAAKERSKKENLKKID